MSEATAVRSFSDYLTIGEASEFLGVSPWTLRNWDKSGKLKSLRHPVSGYRIYRPEDLESLLKAGQLHSRRRRSLTPNLDWNEIGDAEHFVQFYETEEFLIDSVSAYVERALVSGEGAVVIAHREHRQRIHRVLKRRGIDIAAVRRSKQYVALDASELLATFMIGDEPDPGKFNDTVGTVIAESAEAWPKVRGFGEMVALLWANGNREGACKLETLWNDLAKRLSFTLFCAYPIKGFRETDMGASFGDVCGCHSRVIPAESYSTLSTAKEQLHCIALLQQKAHRLEAEIDQRKAAERELYDFIENALEGLHKVGPDGIILWANKAELDLLGYEADEYVGRHIREFHADAVGLESILARLHQGESIYNQPAILRCKDGSLKHVLIHSNAYFQGGQFVYSRCFTRDMTDVRQADRDRAMLAAIIETSQDAIVSKTFDGIIRSWNGGAERIFGYSQDEAVGQPITLIIPPERHGEEVEILARLRRGERIEHYETVRLRKDGTRIDISLTISPLRNSSGQLIGASKIGRDISERKRVEKQLRESEERFRQLVELLPIGVYTCSAPDGALTFYNSQAAQLWGRSPAVGDIAERFCGSHKLFRADDGKYLPHSKCPMAVALYEGTSFRNQEVDIERPDGSRITALVNIEPIHDASGNITGAINVFHDITALKEAQRKLKEEDRRKDEFLATLAHELRNPLAPIRNGLSILRMSGQNGAAASHVQEIMERQVAQMVRLVDDLLELSRISRGKIELKRETAELATVINHALETSKPFIEAGQHHLVVSLPEEPLQVDGDLVRLSQVFANLVNNAAKYTERGGTISVVASAVDNQVIVSVRDTGIGIPRDMLDRIFDMFAQVNNPLRHSQEGLGIGLNLVQTLVQMHGGTVEAHSDGLGMGSEFVVRLPRAVPQSNGVLRPETADVPPTDTGSVRRILCVDDNRDSANSLGMMLKFLGADVHTAYDGRSALDAMKICRPSVILMDLGMPGMDGCEVARRIRRDPEYKDVLLIAMTGWGQEEDRRRSREAGFDHHLVKPVDLKALQALLATV